MRSLFTEISKDKLRAGEGVAEKPVHCVPGLLKKRSAELNLQNKNGEGNLQPQPPGHRLRANGATVRGESVGQAQHGEQSENASEASHRSPLYKSAL